MRNYFQIEKRNKEIFIAEGKETKRFSHKDYNPTKYWNKWEKMENEEKLFARIKELLDKN